MFLAVHLVDGVQVSGVYWSSRGTFMLGWADFLSDLISEKNAHQLFEARTVCAR